MPRPPPQQRKGGKRRHAHSDFVNQLRSLDSQPAQALSTELVAVSAECPCSSSHMAALQLFLPLSPSPVPHLRINYLLPASLPSRFVALQAAQAAAAAAAAPADAAAKGPVLEDEADDLDPNQYFERRMRDLQVCSPVSRPSIKQRLPARLTSRQDMHPQLAGMGFAAAEHVQTTCHYESHDVGRKWTGNIHLRACARHALSHTPAPPARQRGPQAGTRTLTSSTPRCSCLRTWQPTARCRLASSVPTKRWPSRVSASPLPRWAGEGLCIISVRTPVCSCWQRQAHGRLVAHCLMACHRCLDMHAVGRFAR